MTKPSTGCLKRLKLDVESLKKDLPPGIFLERDEHEKTKVHVLIIGPSGTPYEGGFFYFVLKCPPNYPFRHPDTQIKTTDDGQVSFLPIFYSTGRVRLSILGTWNGPGWSPSYTLETVLVYIRNLMEGDYYQAEPFCDPPSNADVLYNRDKIRFETMRVAVCGMLEGLKSDTREMPKLLRDVMEKYFLERYQYYVKICSERKSLSAQMNKIVYTIGNFLYPVARKGDFDYSPVIQRLEAIKVKLDAAHP